MVQTLSTRGTNSADSTLNAGSAINSFLKGSHMALMIIDCMHGNMPSFCISWIIFCTISLLRNLVEKLLGKLMENFYFKFVLILKALKMIHDKKETHYGIL